MPEPDFNSYTDAELVAEFDRLFPQGFAGPDVVQEIAPDGWENSPLLAAYHPSLEQIHEESVRICRNIAALGKHKNAEELSPEPTLEETAKEYQTLPVKAEEEIRDLVGKCLWDIFSDNHDVVAEDGRVLDLGSFRGSGGFLADYLNRHLVRRRYDYMDYYMGTIWLAGRADLGPVYRMIFRRLKSRRLNWVYHYPRVYAIDFSPLKEALDRKDEADWLSYSPEQSLAEEEEKKLREQKLAELRESLDEGYREAIEEALKCPPPTIVQAYEAVYGRLPQGWPPSASDCE
ncbi:MAG TPA: hypothetical protein VGZ47_11600 [Gemmataceae bacterium]|nr:hypothetical protein [Gemmataceae bacterium]